MLSIQRHSQKKRNDDKENPPGQNSAVFFVKLLFLFAMSTGNNEDTGCTSINAF